MFSADLQNTFRPFLFLGECEPTTSAYLPDDGAEQWGDLSRLLPPLRRHSNGPPHPPVDQTETGVTTPLRSRCYPMPRTLSQLLAHRHRIPVYAPRATLGAWAAEGLEALLWRIAGVGRRACCSSAVGVARRLTAPRGQRRAHSAPRPLPRFPLRREPTRPFSAGSAPHRRVSNRRVHARCRAD